MKYETLTTQEGEEYTVWELPRDKFIEVTEAAIREASLDDELADRVRKVAETAPLVAGNVWKMTTPIGECGCLVGWLHQGEKEWECPKSDEEYDVGMEFDNLLAEALGLSSGGWETPHNVVRIVDEEVAA